MRRLQEKRTSDDTNDASRRASNADVSRHGASAGRGGRRSRAAAIRGLSDLDAEVGAGGSNDSTVGADGRGHDTGRSGRSRASGPAGPGRIGTPRSVSPA